MSDDQAAEYRSELRLYLAGLGAAVLLTGIAFGLVGAHIAGRVALLWSIAALALAQIVCHFRFFLHIDLSRSKRDDLQLILFTTLIVILMVGGTLWVIGNADMRMM